MPTPFLTRHSVSHHGPAHLPLLRIPPDLCTPTSSPHPGPVPSSSTAPWIA